ncbi:glyoxysomal processing protease, glyoxysomal isoform X2 [Typha angustifolia]|uniref:glyoxysomal processing protease, glyoxysomal isoform X2 n=1 Tax=Typha angustifolia TaxID=59011 RepID=UPI003C2DBAC2
MGEEKMELPEIARVARNFSAMVRIQGPDPKGLKMRRHAFHLHQSGITTLSASGILLPAGAMCDPPLILDHVCRIHGCSGAVVVTSASIVEPFLVAEHRNNPNDEFSPQLIPHACVDVLVDGQGDRAENGSDEPSNSRWLPSQLLALVDVPTASAALLSVMGDHSGLLDLPWDVGWPSPRLNISPLSKVENDSSLLESHRNNVADISFNSAFIARSATRIAILGISTIELESALHIDASQPQQRGDLLLVMGSPFGILSPLHFLNSVSVGAVANCCHQNSLLMADIRCLPGMEGGPVFDRHAFLVGMLTCPLRQKGSDAEIQLVITWDAIANLLRPKENQNSQEQIIDTNLDNRQMQLLSSYSSCKRSVLHSSEVPHFGCLLPSWKKATSSIALVTVGDGAWASGVVLNHYGLVLTNAHVFEPWRFGRTSLDLTNKTSKPAVQHNWTSPKIDQSSGKEDSQFFPSQLEGSSSSDASVYQASLSNLSYKSYKRISVRLECMGNQIWCDASVLYVSKGPLDVALLQLETIPSQLSAINPEFVCPSLGVPIHVIGHGLLGPQSGQCSSISSGVVSNVVRIPGPVHIDRTRRMKSQNGTVPVMLQTTAAVHPGASGGAVINSDGLMVGLVTSNARHGGGRTIPYLNFSIPCAALEPIFSFADKRDPSILQALDKPNAILTSIWALAPSASPSPRTPFEKNNRERKGSRFSKFISGKHLEQDPHMDLDNISKEKIHSKI